LEWLSHHGLSLSGFNYNRYSINVSDDLIAKYNVDDLPIEWNATPATDMTRDFAEEKLFSSIKHLAIVVPSVIVPEEFNIIINPLHDAFLNVSKTIEFLGEYKAPNRD
jgi:RES domain-containing protein